LGTLIPAFGLGEWDDLSVAGEELL